MNQGHLKMLFYLFIVFAGFKVSKAQNADKIMIVIIDGARYTETLGDPSHKHTPRMWSLSQIGTTITNFANNNYTYTSRAIPALWCGAWTNVQNITYNGSATQYAILPTLWEYYRKGKNMPANDCYYITQYIPSLWLPSFDADYGQNYWPAFHCIGSSDKDVATQTQLVMDNSHPHLIWVYLSGVDHAGHSGKWVDYTKAVFSSDSIVGLLWDKIQSDDFYKNSTTLIVTNDHGRHDDLHGGFSGHGCSCEGCRHIQFLAIGPSIKKDFVSSQYRIIPDLSVTASYILGVNPSKATGAVMQEIFSATSIDEEKGKPFTLNGNYPNPFNSKTTIQYYLNKPEMVDLSIYSISGERLITLVSEWQSKGAKTVEWNAMNSFGSKVNSGVYFYQLHAGEQLETRKILFIDSKK